VDKAPRVGGFTEVVIDLNYVDEVENLLMHRAPFG
jgi:hypothetical protein